MNKYILRTSLFWLCILAIVVGFFLYRPHAVKKEIGLSSGPQPVAAGPDPGTGDLPAKPERRLWKHRWRPCSLRRKACRASA